MLRLTLAQFVQFFRGGYTMSGLIFLFLTAVIVTVSAQRDNLGIRQINGVTIPETNVIYWENLPPTNGVRYECSRPVEDTQVFMNCQTNGLDNKMSRATCQCASGPGQFFLTCYKDGKWYPPIKSSCEGSSSMSSPVTESATRTSDASSIKFSMFILASSLLFTLW